MRPLRQSFCFVLLMGLAAVSALAQDQASSILASVTTGSRAAQPFALSADTLTFRAEVNEVEIQFSAIASNGLPISDLEAGDVEVIADGGTEAPIRSFRKLDRRPIRLGILVDLSESVRPEMHLQVITLSTALSNILQSSRDREFAVAFSNTMDVLHPETSDFMQVERSLESARGNHNLTALNDAIVRTCREQFAGSRDEQRIVLLFSDGMDNLSVHSLDDAIEAARSAGVIVYAVAGSGSDSEGIRALERLTARTGGKLEIFQRREDPEPLLATLRSYSTDDYLLTFAAPSTQPGFHRVELRATHRPLTLRGTDGYLVAASPR